MARPVLLYPAMVTPLPVDGVEYVELPSEAGARAAFLRDVAPHIEIGLGAGGIGYPDDFLAAAEKLRVICCLGVGFDRFDPDLMHARGITVTNCPGVNAVDVAEMALGLMLSVTRGIAVGDADVRAGRWRASGLWRNRLGGRKLGIVGFGAIGAEIAKRAAAFDLDIAWTGPRAKAQAPYPFVPSLLDLARWADILVVATRADPSTEKMIDAGVLEALGPKGVLINISRGSVVDEPALVAALKAGVIGGAGLDVFENEPTDATRWASVPNTTLTPHVAGATVESTALSARIIQENIRRFFAGEPVLHAVN